LSAALAEVERLKARQTNIREYEFVNPEGGVISVARVDANWLVRKGLKGDQILATGGTWLYEPTSIKDVAYFKRTRHSHEKALELASKEVEKRKALGERKK
jgi:hypothetical protein